ncbi:uncharacterized protein H6S33_011993 [Morchella sextelata]|uniref:uncharacterized protein n=1 Tax=Morchella sextelata TaxID=1174677 RepID=UPI001D036948|nr:uncharacterized protein H6S33_011993 [Morchella sextelata]KAH0610466.1 hypothetical protein H6S33_011993 [Morchella sextelata]
MLVLIADNKLSKNLILGNPEYLGQRKHIGTDIDREKENASFKTSYLIIAVNVRPSEYTLRFYHHDISRPQNKKRKMIEHFGERKSGLTIECQGYSHISPRFSNISAPETVSRIIHNHCFRTLEKTYSKAYYANTRPPSGGSFFAAPLLVRFFAPRANRNMDFVGNLCIELHCHELGDKKKCL